MFLTPSQLRFAQSTMQQSVVVVPDMFKDAWARVQEENRSINLMNVEEKTVLLSQEVDKEMKQKCTAIIETQAKTPDEERQQKQRLTEGQCLLVRKRGEEVFDTLLLPEDLANAKPLEYEIFGPALQPYTNDLKEVMDVQSLMHVVSNLQQWVNIESAALTEDGIEVNVVDKKTLKRGVIRVKIDPSEPRSLLYDMGEDTKGPRFIPEEEMPDWGSIVDSVIHTPQYLKGLATMQLQQNENMMGAAAEGLMVATAALWGGQGMARNRTANEAIIQDQMGDEPEQHVLIPNRVKAPRRMNAGDVQAKARARNKAYQGEQERMRERRKKAREEQDLEVKRKYEEGVLAQEAARRKQMDTSGSYAGLGAGIGTAIAAVGSAFGSFLILS